MSIDNYIWVPAGARGDTSMCYRNYKPWAEMRAAEPSPVPPHQVFLAHQHLIDEQYFFEAVDDARWFWDEGYKERLYLDEQGMPMSHDRMALWVDGEDA